VARVREPLFVLRAGARGWTPTPPRLRPAFPPAEGGSVYDQLLLRSDTQESIFPPLRFFFFTASTSFFFGFPCR
jgi:hypothetical protein